MRGKLALLILFLLTVCRLPAQPKYKDWNLSAGIGLPTGNFSETHWIGMQMMAEYAPKRFGKLKALPKHPLGLMISCGFGYWAGKKETVSSYPFRYGNFSVLHLFGGASYRPSKNIVLKGSAGPALSHYEGHVRFNIGTEWGGQWYFQPQWGIGSSLTLLKELKARPLLMIGIRGNYAF